MCRQKRRIEQNLMKNREFRSNSRYASTMIPATIQVVLATLKWNRLIARATHNFETKRLICDPFSSNYSKFQIMPYLGKRKSISKSLHNQKTRHAIRMKRYRNNKNHLAIQLEWVQESLFTLFLNDMYSNKIQILCEIHTFSWFFFIY